jgi:hypothetical protein
MRARKSKISSEKPTRAAEAIGTHERLEKSPADPPRKPPEPFEECGPTGGYGGAGTDGETKED